VARHASLQRTVTVFENLDLTLADATIALYDAKYHYLVWRPVTAIQLGNTIGNPGITGDPTWLPLAVIAADPSYPGAHATISEAAATVLAAFYGDHRRRNHRPRRHHRPQHPGQPATRPPAARQPQGSQTAHVPIRLQEPAHRPANLQGNDQHQHLDNPAQPLTTRPWPKGRLSARSDN
jgi:hypothetical protein